MYSNEGTETAKQGREAGIGRSTLALEVRGLTKTFGDVKVLDDVCFALRSGEILGLVGRNGAGKSTLIKILSGYHAADPGSEVKLLGETLPTNVEGLKRSGIVVIQQDLGLCEELSVLENFGVASSYGASWRGIRWRRERHRLKLLMGELGVWVDPDARVEDLHPPAKATVAVLRAMRLMADTERKQPLLVLDEPTVYMGREDRDRLFSLVRGLVSRGGAAVFVSHRLGEVVELCDQIVVLRDGVVSAQMARHSASLERVVDALLGDEADGAERAGRRLMGVGIAEVIEASASAGYLAAEHLGGRVLDDVSFSVAPGEILGFTGLVGMGQEELPYLLVGEARGQGTVRVGAEQRIVGRNAAAMVAAGVSVVPANRNRHAIWRDGAARENVTINMLGQFWSHGLLQKKAEVKAVDALINRFGVRPAETERPLNRFSGGNQQKLVMARVLGASPRVLVLHEPTQGVDVGARGEIWYYIRAIAATGACVVICSSEVEEVVSLCSRVLVLRDGKVVKELAGDNVTESALLVEINAGVRLAMVDRKL